MPLPDERPRQSVANLIGKFEQGGKRGSGSNGAGVARRQSQGVLGSTTPAMPLKAQYTGQSTSAISVQSGPRSPPIKASELVNTTGTDVPSWRKTTLPQATVPPDTEIPQPESTLDAGTEGQETTPSNIKDQKVTSDEPAAVPVPTEPEQATAPNDPTTPRPPPEKTTRVVKTTSNTGTSSTAKPKVASSTATKPTASGSSKTTKPPASSRPSTLSKATASGSAKTSRPSVVPPAAPLKPQVTGGSTTANRLSAPTAASKARIASAEAAASSSTAKRSAPSASTTKPSTPSSSTIKRATGPVNPASPPRKVVPKSTPVTSGTLAPAKKAPLPRSTVPTSKATTSTPTTVRKTVPTPSTSKTATTSKAPAVKPLAAPRVGLAGAGRVKNPSGPAKLIAAGGLIGGVPAAALLLGDKEEATTEEAPVADKPQEFMDAPVEAEAKTQDEGTTVASEETVESTDEPGDETVMQKSDTNEEGTHLDETASHGEPTEEHIDDADSHEEPTEDHLDGTSNNVEPEGSLIEADHHRQEGHVNQEDVALSETAEQEEVEASESVGHDGYGDEDGDAHEGEMSMEVEDAEAEAREDSEHLEGEVLMEEGEEGEVYDGHPSEELQEDQDHVSAPPPPSHEEPVGRTFTPSEDGGGGDWEDAVALLEGGNPHNMGQPVDLFSPGYTGESSEKRMTLTQEASPNPGQREVGDIPDDE